VGEKKFPIEHMKGALWPVWKEGTDRGRPEHLGEKGGKRLDRSREVTQRGGTEKRGKKKVKT